MPMFDHLINNEYVPEIIDAQIAVSGKVARAIQTLEKADTTTILDAKVNTAEWLQSLGVDDGVEDGVQVRAARTAFAAITTQTTSPDEQKLALAGLKSPVAVQHIVGMLSAYDWQFVQQAGEIRGFVVAKLMEETKNPTGSIRLRALELLGKVTEVALFTDRVEVKKTALSDTELELRIKEKLNKFMGVLDVMDVNDQAYKPDPA